MGRVTGYLRGVLDEVMPSAVDCAVHEAEGSGGWRADAREEYCPRCGASAGPGSVTGRGCAFCVNEKIAWDRITRLSAYRPPMDGWIKAMKFGRQWTWAGYLGGQLADRLGENNAGAVVVCPVPMPWRRRWSRGFNQAALIAEAVAEKRQWPLVEALRRTRHTRPQTAVAPSQRPANVRGSLEAAAIDLAGHDVVLIDDIKTSGSTLTACTKLLKQAGARGVHAAVAAVADPKGSDFRVK